VIDEVACIDAETCIGCGLCVTGCQKDAPTLVRREAVIDPADTTRGMGFKMLQGQGKLEEFVRPAFRLRGRGWPVSVSIGAVTFMSTPGLLEEMLRREDSLMYEVKSGGRNEIKLEVVAP
jgi:ferredoxin